LDAHFKWQGERWDASVQGTLHVQSGEKKRKKKNINVSSTKEQGEKKEKKRETFGRNDTKKSKRTKTWGGAWGKNYANRPR